MLTPLSTFAKTYRAKDWRWAQNNLLNGPQVSVDSSHYHLLNASLSSNASFNDNNKLVVIGSLRQ